MYESMAIQLGNMGIAQRHRKRLSEALRYFREALRMNRRLGRREGIMENVGNIAAVLGDQGRHDEAVIEFDRAIALARKIGEREGLAVNYEMKGNLLKKMGHKGLSRMALRASLRHYRKLGNKRKAHEIEMELRFLEND
jgi:tetratricopeptide (TPR) repeat protein